MMAGRAAFVGLSLLVCGCGGSPEPHAARQARAGVAVAAPPAASTIDTDVPPEVAVELPMMQEVCSDVKPPASQPATVIIEFPPQAIPPVTYGARAAERPLRERPRSADTLKAWMKERGAELRRCYRWARFAEPTLEGALPIVIEVAPRGDVTVTVSGKGRFRELARCAEDVLEAAPLHSVTARKTVVRTEIRFARTGLPVPDTRPPRPRTSASAAQPGCVLTRTPLPADELAVPPPTVDDFDFRQSERERQLAACKGQRGCHITYPTDLGPMSPRVVITPHLDADSAARTLAENRAGFGACFAAAGAGTEAATIELRIEVPADGRARNAVVEKSAGSTPALDACLQAALLELRFPPLREGFAIVRVPFTRAPAPPLPLPLAARDTPANLLLAAERALDAGDADTARRRFRALDRAAPSCEAALGVLRAERLARPWQGEPVVVAARALMDRKASGGCREQALPLLLELGRTPLDEGRATRSSETLELALERFRMLSADGEKAGDEDLRRAADDGIRQTLHALGRDGDPDNLSAVRP